MHTKAERARQEYPSNKQLQVCALIHDIGKILFTFGEDTEFIVGDTFVLGHKIPDKVVCYDSIDKNIINNYNSIYTSNCGLDKVTLSFGQDEYLYIVLTGNKNHKLEQKYIDIIRYHSFYPWHTNGCYRELMSDKDLSLLKCY